MLTYARDGLFDLREHLRNLILQDKQLYYPEWMEGEWEVTSGEKAFFLKRCQKPMRNNFFEGPGSSLGVPLNLMSLSLYLALMPACPPNSTESRRLLLSIPSLSPPLRHCDRTVLSFRVCGQSFPERRAVCLPKCEGR